MADLKLEKITKRYRDNTVLKKFDLAIEDGEFLTLVGPSGCGKSTLLRIIAGLDAQTNGEVYIGGNPMGRVRPSERNLAMVFQSYALYPHLTVFDNIAVPLRMRGTSRWHRLPMARWLLPGARRHEAAVAARVMDVAGALGLIDLLQHKPGELSGGQRQRVAVGRAIVRDPAAFLFDEPLSNLDAKLRVHMRAEITQLHRKLKATFVYVTHDQAEAMTMSDRIAVMMGGELVQVGTPDEVYSDPKDIRVAEFIGSPKINLFPGETTQAGVVVLMGRTTAIQLGACEPGPLRIGVRPEDLRLCNARTALLNGRVELIENLGSEVFVHFRIAPNDESFVLRMAPAAARRLHLNDALPLDFVADDALIFDWNGKRIDQAPKSAAVIHV